LASSTSVEHHVFIIRKTICTCSFVWYVFIYFCKQSSRWKDVSSTSFQGQACILSWKDRIQVYPEMLVSDLYAQPSDLQRLIGYSLCMSMIDYQYNNPAVNHTEAIHMGSRLSSISQKHS